MGRQFDARRGSLNFEDAEETVVARPTAIPAEAKPVPVSEDDSAVEEEESKHPKTPKKVRVRVGENSLVAARWARGLTRPSRPDTRACVCLSV